MKKKPLSEEAKIKMAKLLEEDFVRGVLDKNLGKYYPDFVKVEEISSKPYKKHIGVTSTVFVVEYKIKYQNKDAKHIDIEIFASAHSDGSRLGAYEKTKMLYEHGFDQGDFRVTKPLFFLKEQKAFFYISSPGRSLFNFFIEDPKADLRPAMELAAGWIRKLHDFDIKSEGFKWPSFEIDTMIPSPEQFVDDFYNDSKETGKMVEGLLNALKSQADFYNQKNDKQLIYGDCHPENVIIKDLSAKDLEMIDFTDLALGDPMMDIGTFIQQFDFMGHNFISRDEMNNYKTFFVEAYFVKEFDKIEIEYINRINIYQSWTALRTAIFLFYMKNVENPVDDLLEDAVNYLNLAKNSEPRINLS